MPREIHPAATILTRDRLKRLVETVFWASREREEWRNVAYDVPPTADGYAIKFQASLPFSVRAITKLAPATKGLPHAGRGR